MARIGSNVRLLKAAEEALIEGEGHFEMLDIAKRAGVSVGLAYHHFGSKNGLLATLVDNFYAPLREIALGTAIPPSMPWALRERARTAAIIDHYFDAPLAPLIAGRLGRAPEVLDVEQAHMAALLEEGARNIRQGQRIGVVRPDLDADITVAMLMGGLKQALSQIVRGKALPDRTLLLETFWRFTEGALGLPPGMAQGEDIDEAAKQY